MGWSSSLSDILNDPWGAVKGMWAYLMEMPIGVAIGLAGATLMVFIFMVVIYLIRRPGISMVMFVAPILTVFIVWMSLVFGGGSPDGFWANLVRLFSFFGFLWVVAMFIVTCVTPKRQR